MHIKLVRNRTGTRFVARPRGPFLPLKPHSHRAIAVFLRRLRTADHYRNDSVQAAHPLRNDRGVEAADVR